MNLPDNLANSATQVDDAGTQWRITYDEDVPNGTYTWGEQPAIITTTGGVLAGGTATIS